MVSLGIGPSTVWTSFSSYAFFSIKEFVHYFWLLFTFRYSLPIAIFVGFFPSLFSLFLLASSRNGTVHKSLSEERVAGASALNHCCTVLKVHLRFGKNLQPFLKQDFHL